MRLRRPPGHPRRPDGPEPTSGLLDDLDGLNRELLDSLDQASTIDLDALTGLNDLDLDGLTRQPALDDLEG